MTKIDMITAMFEEIKDKLDLLYQKSDNDVASLHNNGSDKKSKGINIQDLSSIMADIVDFSMQNVGSIIQQENEELVSKSNKQFQKVDNQINQLVYHFKKWKNMIFKIVVLQVIVLICIILNISLLNENRRLKDSELQLKYLKATNKVDKRLSGRLDTIFYIHRNEEAIEHLKRIVTDK
nr:hypothetical protein [uncultured Carboxylicivirga sp.]